MQHRWKLAGATSMALAAMAGGAWAQEPAQLDGVPNLNGVWQSLSGANWNLEPHSAAVAPAGAELLGAIGAIPAGLGVVEGGTIPYLPAALEQRDANRAGAPGTDPEAACYLPGIPRATYMDHPFQIIQSGAGDMLFVYEYGSANRVIHVEDPMVAPIDTYMGTSNGAWDGDTFVVTTTAQNGETWMDRAGNYLTNTATVTERFTLMGENHIQYEATIEDPAVYSAPWTISMPLYRRLEPNVQILEFKCVPFAEDLLYGDLKPADAQ